MRKEDCKVGDVVILTNSQMWLGFNGIVTNCEKDVAEVALCAVNCKVWPKYEDIERYCSEWNNSSSKDEVLGPGCDRNGRLDMIKKIVYNPGDMVVIRKRGHNANGCVGTVEKADRDRDIVVVSVKFSDEIEKYAFGFNDIELIRKPFGGDRTNENAKKVQYVKTELTVAGYERLNDIRTKYRLFDNDRYYIGSIEAAREFCEAVIMCTQYGLNMDDEDDEFIMEICQELGMDDMLNGLYARKTGTKITERQDG